MMLDTIDQFKWITMYMHNIYTLYAFGCNTELHPPSFDKKILPYTFYHLILVCLQILYPQMPKLHLHTWCRSDQFAMVLVFNDDHIIHYLFVY